MLRPLWLIGMTSMTGLCVVTWVRVVQLNWEKLSGNMHWNSMLVLLIMLLPSILVWKDLGWGHPKEVCESKARELQQWLAIVSILLLGFGTTLLMFEPLIK